jgi:hypothetical protein
VVSNPSTPESNLYVIDTTKDLVIFTVDGI